MNKSKKTRNPIAVAMRIRYGKTTTKMQDRRRERGGQRNHQRDFLSEKY